MILKEIFTEIYENNLWDSVESKSGSGSELQHTEVLRKEVPILIEKFNIKSVLDIPCGDWNWIKHMDLHATYIGADIVEPLIETNRINHPHIDFRVLDLTTDDLPKVDLIFVRDCLGHLSNENVLKAIENMKRSGSKYFLATSYTKFNHNNDTKNGGWKCINLMIEPFFLNPQYLINEDCKESYPRYNDKCMILFKLNDLYKEY
jgi:SAM-dependent methyltransferase